MKTVKAMHMNAEDWFIYKIFMGFLAAPLLLILLAAAVYAILAR